MHSFSLAQRFCYITTRFKTVITAPTTCVITNVYRWVNDVRDPNSETVVAIVQALKSLNPAAAQTFVWLYLGELVEDE